MHKTAFSFEFSLKKVFLFERVCVVVRVLVGCTGDKREFYSTYPFIDSPKTRRLREVEPDVVLYVAYYNIIFEMQFFLLQLPGKAIYPGEREMEKTLREVPGTPGVWA